jgi:hypothetical protein
MMQRSDSLQELTPPTANRADDTGDRYYVELALEALDEQGSLLDALIDFTFDTLHVQHLDLRIVTERH